MHNKNKMQNNRRNPTTEEISYSISGKGKSWSYEYGKLYPGRYRLPLLGTPLVAGLLPSFIYGGRGTPRHINCLNRVRCPPPPFTPPVILS